jgi:uncharacterized protein (DUF58 family)
MSVTTAGERRTFPLVPRRRSTGHPFGDLPSRRRGHGSDIIGTRPYESGDPITSIDWFASARLSSATGGDEFVVRDRAADEAARVVVVVDRRPAMSLYPPPFPWLAKHVALREAVTAIAASAAAARADIAELDFGDGDAYWLPPGRWDRQWQVIERANGGTPFAAPEDTLARSLAFLTEHRTGLQAGTFVFVLSDFLAPPPPEAWQDAVAHGWDVVPVVIQDSVWERSFPAVGGVGVPVADPRTGDVTLVRLGRRQAARRREENEERYALLLTELESFGLEVVEISASEPAAVDGAFIAWAEERRRRRWTR